MDLYYNKYIKYKQKYLNLKGGFPLENTKYYELSILNNPIYYFKDSNNLVGYFNNNTLEIFYYKNDNTYYYDFNGTEYSSFDRTFWYYDNKLNTWVQYTPITTYNYDSNGNILNISHNDYKLYYNELINHQFYKPIIRNKLLLLLHNNHLNNYFIKEINQNSKKCYSDKSPLPTDKENIIQYFENSFI